MENSKKINPPRGKTIFSGLNSHCVHMGKLIEYYQDEVGTGGVYLESHNAEGAIFFNSDTIVNVFYHDKDNWLDGENARDRLIDVLKKQNFIVDVYQIETGALEGCISETIKDIIKEFEAPAVVNPSLNLPTPESVGRYSISSVLGQGSMGLVFLGKDPYIERDVAIKIAKPSKEIFKQEIESYNRSFFHEARSVGRLNHPNIVAVYDADMYENSCYIAMEYVDGPNLRKFCEKDSLLDVGKVVEIIFNACKALDYAHNSGIVHWDIKPENMLLNNYGTVKITDFGIARLKHESLSEVKEDSFANITGTLKYMSPQHIKAPNNVDNRNDIFSLGCIFYEMLTGVKAFQGNDQYAIMYQILNKEPMPMGQVRPELPKILEKIVEKALRKDPDMRYQSCMDFSYDLAVAARHLDMEKKEAKVVNVLDYIANIPFFKDFSKEQVKQIVAVSSVLKLPAGKVVVAEGEVDDTLFIILSGRVAVLKQNNKIDTIERGECFGEMAYLSGQPRAATIEADTDCILMKISATLMSKAPEGLQLLFLKTFAKTLVDRTLKNHKLILSLLEKIRLLDNSRK